MSSVPTYQVLSCKGDQEETVHMQLDGILAEMLIKCDPACYEKYVIYEGSQKVLYVELVKGLYGTLRAALIFWCCLTHKLLEWGFKINPITGVS